MTKESSLLIKICDWISKYFIFAAIFLTPVFFAPWTTDILDFNKQFALVILVFIALFAWMIKVLALGKIAINKSWVHIIAALFFLVYIFATVFSVNPVGSFWGWPQPGPDSLLTVMAVLAAYFIISNVFSKKDIFVSVSVFCLSSAIAQLLAVFQLFGLFLLPFDFTKILTFSTIGSVAGLAFFTASLLPLAIVLLIISKKWWKILFAVQIVLSAIILFVVHFTVAWWVTIIFSFLMLAFGVFKKNCFDARWLALPMFFLAVSLFFLVFHPTIFWLNKVNEIHLLWQPSFEITLQTLRERPVLGSGPGTFYYDYARFKDSEMAKSSLWDANFSQAGSKILNDLATTGVAGLAAFLALMALPVFYGIKFLLSEKNIKGREWTLLLGLTASLAAVDVSYFLYSNNFVLFFFFFLIIGGIVNFTSQPRREYSTRYSSFAMLAAVFFFTIIFIFGAGLLVLSCQRYVAEISYTRAMRFLENNNMDRGEKALFFAAKINSSSDLYFRQLSQLYLQKLRIFTESIKTEPDEEQKNRITEMLADCVNSAKIATDINPNNAANWLNRGYIYQSLFEFVDDSMDWAIGCYDKAIKLEPYNPYPYMQEGNVNFVSYLRSGAGLPEAKEKLEKALALKPDYLQALYSLGLVYDVMGQASKAREIFAQIKKIDPNNTAGLPLLQGQPLAPEIPPEAEK